MKSLMLNSSAFAAVVGFGIPLPPVIAQEPQEAEQEFLAQGPYHRAITAAESPALARLRAAGAVLSLEDYGSFALVVVDERPVGGVGALRATGAEIVDYMTLVDFNGYRIDGADPVATSAGLASIPDILRAPTTPPRGEARLMVVQFIGPLKDAWLDALRETEVFVVTYAANNAYVVMVDPLASAVVDLFAKRPYVLSFSSYEPAFKLRPELRPPALVDTDIYDVIVQVIADNGGSAFAESLRTRAIAVLSEPESVLNYINIGLRLGGANLLDLARDPHVFAIEPKLQAHLLDERQGQIVSGNLDANGSQPSGPNYFTWLASVGFPGTDPFDFVVDLADSGIDRGGAQTERVSVATGGAQANYPSGYPSTSADGRYVAFTTSDILVPGDTNGVLDVFVRDRENGMTERVSVATDGTQGNSHSGGEGLSISADGRYVAFGSYATNLVLGDTNSRVDIFVHDRMTGTTGRVSVATGGTEGNFHSGFPSISADGRYVAFVSDANNLVADDTIGTDVFVHDRQSGTTERVSVDSGGAQGNSQSYFGSISADGRYVVFGSDATNLVPGDTNGYVDVFVRDRQSGTTERVNVDSTGAQANEGSWWDASISSDGRYVSFTSFAYNLVAGDTNGWDTFVHDRQSGTTELVSVDSGELQANYDSFYYPSISADGRYVAFTSYATNLVPGDTNLWPDVFVRDRQSGTTERVSVDSCGVQGNRGSGISTDRLSISGDGRYVAFVSDATNLVPGDTNGILDVFVRVRNDVNDEFKVGGLTTGESRVGYNYNYSGDPLSDDRGGHGTIDASIVCGYNSTTATAFEDLLGYQYGLGIAPWVKVGNSKVFNNDGTAGFSQPTNTRMANAYNCGARISSNSWGGSSGASYTTDSQAHDVAVRDAVSGTAGNQEMTIVFAAGNGGPGASTIGSPGTAKNVITVGASENWRMTGTDGCGMANSDADDARDLAWFSSRGPTSDSRKKPDILAPGTHIQGAASRATGYTGSGLCPGQPYYPPGQTLYVWASGTSQATPAIAGACALLRQRFLNEDLDPPSPALTKALLIAGATYMTGENDTLWSNNQGMGRVNLALTLEATTGVLVDQTHVFGATSEIYQLGGLLPPSFQPVRVVLAWTDAPGPTSGNAYVNNLDLSVTVNGTPYLGNVFSGATSAAGGSADARNNLESVFLPPGTNGTFIVTVRATNIAGDGVPGNADLTDQDFALVAYGPMVVVRLK